MVLFGVDVHGVYQAGISFSRLASEGYSYAVIKATEGTNFRPVNFEAWVAATRAAGMIPGGYHFLRAGDGAAQARFFLDRIRGVGGPSGMLIQLDCESDGYGAEMTEWFGEWNRLTGKHPVLIYSGGWWWPRTGGFRGAGLTPYLWNSHYLAGGGTAGQLYPQVPASWWTPGYGGWSTATILQFTDQGTAGGLTNNVDLNAFQGTRAQLLALTGTTTTGDDDMTAEQTANDLMFGWSVLTGAHAALYPNEQPGPRVDVGNPLHDKLDKLIASQAALNAKIDLIASKVDLDPAELAAVADAAFAGAKEGATGAAQEAVADALRKAAEAADGTPG